MPLTFGFSGVQEEKWTCGLGEYSKLEGARVETANKRYDFHLEKNLHACMKRIDKRKYTHDATDSGSIGHFVLLSKRRMSSVKHSPKISLKTRCKIRRNGTGKCTVRSIEREFVANELALFLGMVV